jgi:hypothetical protein
LINWLSRLLEQSTSVNRKGSGDWTGKATVVP